MDEQVLESPPAPPPKSGATARARREDVSAAPKASATVANVRAFGFAMLIAFALMALFNSSGLRSWARDLPDGWLADEIIVAADGWHALMLALGPAHARPAAREAFEAVRKFAW